MTATLIADAEEHARTLLAAEIAAHRWPEPARIEFIRHEGMAFADGRPSLIVTMRSAADVHVAAGLMGRTAHVTFYAGREPHETDPAGRWYAARHTVLRIEHWDGDVALQVSRYETIESPR